MAMRSFVQVVDTGSFTGAARQSGRSKARISQTIGALEAELGVTLLQRTTRALKLTEAGERYYRRCSELLDEIAGLEASLREGSTGLEGQLRVTAPPGLANRFLRELTVDFAKHHPKITIDLLLTHRMLNLVEERIDVAIRVTNPDDSSLVARKLAPAPLLAAASPRYLKAHGVPKKPSDLKLHSCIVDTNFRERQRWRFHYRGKATSVVVAGQFSVNSPMAVRDLALEHCGIALLPSFVAEPELSRGRLVEVLEGQVALRWSTYALYPRRPYLPERTRAYVEHLVQVLS